MTANLRPLAALLVESARGTNDAIDPAVAKIAATTLFESARLHRVVPALRRRLRSKPGVPIEWTPSLDAARHGQLLRHMQASNDLSVLSRVFAESNVRWAISKGPVLSDVIWPHPDMREYTDLDVFVQPADFAKALDAVEAAGFSLVDRNWPEMRRQRRAEVALRGPSGFALDLHWDIAVTPGARRSFRINLPSMLDRTRTVTLGTGLSVPAFDPTDLLLHVAFHAAGSGANRLVWIADVYHASHAAGVDWKLLNERARHARMATPISMVLARAERTFGCTLPLPDELRARALTSLSGRVAIRRDDLHPFPGLPGDGSLSGVEYSSARENAAASAALAAWQWFDVRRIEARVRRDGGETNLLDEDVPDVSARRDYLRSVLTPA